MAVLGLISLMVIAVGDHFATGTCVASEPLIYACPGNAPYYNLRPCIPTEPSQCPRGFACMLSRLIKGGKPSDQFTHLCCDSSKMNFADWLVALQLSPQVIPRAPSASLDSVRLTNFDYNVIAPEVHMNDELQVLDFPNYVTGNVNSLRFSTLLPPPNGFLHVLQLIDASRNQCAIFLNYDIPSEGNAEANISTSDGNQRFFGAISSSTVPEQPVYRHQYVVLVFHTNRQLSQFVNITADISAYLQQIAYFLSTSSTGRALGQPIAGTFFYIISQRSPFPVLATAVKPQSDEAASISFSPSCSLLIFVLVSLLSS